MFTSLHSSINNLEILKDIKADTMMFYCIFFIPLLYFFSSLCCVAPQSQHGTQPNMMFMTGETIFVEIRTWSWHKLNIFIFLESAPKNCQFDALFGLNTTFIPWNLITYKIIQLASPFWLRPLYFCKTFRQQMQMHSDRTESRFRPQILAVGFFFYS